jgi:hypothetical protein
MAIRKRRLIPRVALLASVLSMMFAPAPTSAAEPAKHIGIYVQPYYEAAQDPQGHPRVNVGKALDVLLASNSRADIVSAREQVVANPNLITPMTMMVLAIRLYDVGLRDDSVFWFYVAKDRYGALTEVIDVNAAGLSEVDAAMKSFASLAGPFINGYAFCDLANQQRLRRDALAWVESHPYEAMFLRDLPARPGDRRANLRRAIENAKVAAEKERAHFDDPKNVEAYYAARKKNEMDEKSCWK